MQRIFLICIALLLLLLGACASEPGARSLDEIEPPEAIPAATLSESRTLTEADSRPLEARASTSGARTPEHSAPKTPEATATEEPRSKPPGLDRGDYEALEHKKVKGGRLSLDFPGTPATIGARLVNFDASARHRAWAQRFELIEADADSMKVRWHFEGKAGVNPAPVLEFQIRRREPDFYCRFRIVEEDFGLAAFFGDYHVVALPADDEGRPRSRFSQRVYIDSGLWIANASAEEIEAGLREDARLLHAWIAELPDKLE